MLEISLCSQRPGCAGMMDPMHGVLRCSSHAPQRGLTKKHVPYRETIQNSIPARLPGRCALASKVEVAAPAVPIARPEGILDYGSDSDLPMMRGDTLARRRSLYHLRDSRRRDSITKM